MDYDIGNQHLLQAGAYYQQHMNETQDWRPIATAPHDGTIIEVRCTYGVAPWYGLYRWIKEESWRFSPNGGPGEHVTGRWAKVGEDNVGFDGDSTFSWRPYTGNPTSYVDPTGGAQTSAAYWRGAVAQKYGLPLDTFERETYRNGHPGFWGWLTSFFH